VLLVLLVVLVIPGWSVRSGPCEEEEELRGCLLVVAGAAVVAELALLVIVVGVAPESRC